MWIPFAGIVVLLALASVIAYPGSNAWGVQWVPFTKNAKTLYPFERLKLILGLDLVGGTRLLYEADTSSIPETDRVSSLDGVRDVIERRVNTFGVSEPVVQTNRSGSSWRVSVELPGIKDITAAITRIGETPTLEFKEPPPPLTEEQTKQLEDDNAAVKAKADDIQKRVKAGEDFGKLAAEFSEDPGSKDNGGDIGYVTKGQLVPEYENEIFDVLKVGEVSAEPVKSSFGYHIIKKTGERGEGGQKEVSSSHILIRTKTESDFQAPGSVDQYGFMNTALSGKELKSSQVDFDPNSGEPQVLLAFNADGTKLFAEITKRNVGKPVAIYLDGQPISVPRVQQEISGGSAVISGQFTIQEAKQLSQRLNAGALPVPITLVSQENVEASLGRASVERSMIAGMIGLVLVSLFMILIYRLPGILAVAALVLYTLVLFSIFKLSSLTAFPVTLTLAGIAGFILSVGMAVDANILIFERTKEELRSGKTLTDAIEDGFRRAWLSIRDSNASSLITSFILAWFGTSIIKGFAIILALGILVSMFSAITVTRTLMRSVVGPWLEKRLFLLGSIPRSNETSK